MTTLFIAVCQADDGGGGGGGGKKADAGGGAGGGGRKAPALIEVPGSAKVGTKGNTQMQQQPRAVCTVVARKRFGREILSKYLTFLSIILLIEEIYFPK